MKNIISVFSAIIVCFFVTGFVTSGSVPVVYAETVISGGIIDRDTTWDVDGSPYRISGRVNIPIGITLTIDPGVEVSWLGPENDAVLDIDGGSLIARGNGSDRVSIHDLYHIRADNGRVELYNTDIQRVAAMFFEYSVLRMATTTITDGVTSMAVGGSDVKIWGSRITSNRYGIRIYHASGPHLIFNQEIDKSIDHQFGVGGIGNALDDGDEPSFDITGSVIDDNGAYALLNDSVNMASAVGNWWGSPSGPVLAEDNENGGVSGPVAYEPWLTSEPVFDTNDDGLDQTQCCSNILFLPGLQGTRLFRMESGPFGLGSSVNRLWEPSSNADVEKLYLDGMGLSSDQHIWSGEPIDEALGIVDVYRKFMNFLDELSSKGTINEWKSFGYDWRKPIAEVVAGAEKKATTTESLIQTVTDLASRSRTGKVTIIAHSNGGLVAKYLVKTLSDIGRSDIVDKLISVAVPYIGTPQAIAGILHGDGQSIGYGLVLKQSVARQLGLNMASAYSLLPSAEYFSKVLGPTVVFASATTTGLNDGSYPQVIGSAIDQAAFINDLNDVRNVPIESDTDTPIIGNRFLMAAADLLHGILDPFSWPATITRWAIIGWNRDTTKEIVYDSERSCKRSLCKDIIIHTATTTKMGDGTVIAPSASYNAGEVTSLDLNVISKNERSRLDHANILESSTTQAAIERSITGDREPVCQKLVYVPGVSCGEPDYSKEPTSLILRTFSPVELHVYDEEGNHTGVIPKPTDLDEEVEDGLYTFYESNIPGSSITFMGGGEDYDDTQIYLPDDGSEYRVEIKGIGIGTFDFEIERARGGPVLGHAGYDNIPVTPFTIATTTIRYTPVGFGATSTPGFTSSTAPLTIDFDGDGSPDAHVRPTSSSMEKMDAVLFAKALKKMIVGMIGSKTPRARSVQAFLETLERRADMIGVDKMDLLLRRIAEYVGGRSVGDLTDTEKEQILDLMYNFALQNR